MNNFPENENLNEQEEISTIFSDPTQHKKVATKNGNKKRLTIVISALVAVAVLIGGTFAVVKLIPEKQEETSSNSFEEIEVLSKKDTDYKTVTLTNKNGSFKFYSVITKAEDKDSEDTAQWYLDGYEKDLVSTSSISQLVSSLTEISASREITQKTAAECGLENPAIKADVVTQDDGVFSILIGNKSPDNSGVYLKLSTKDTIYLISDLLDDTLTFEALDLANSDGIPGLTLDSKYNDYTNEGKLISFDSMTISGNNFTKEVFIKANTDSTTVEFMPYIVTKPSERVAEKTDKMLELFANGVTVSGAYSFDVAPATLRKLGLDKPDFMATIKIKDYTYTYKFKLQSDGDYAVVTDDSKQIKRVTVGSYEFLDYTETDYYASWVFIESIDKIGNLTVKLGDKNYSFDIKENADDENDDAPYIITYDGKNLTSDNFQTFYRYCISLACSDFVAGEYNTEDEAALIYTYNDGKTSPVKVTFKKATATKYQYSLNGKPMGKVNASEFKKLEKYLQQLINGETVSYN